MIKIGITGGIGSGKSTVSNIFRICGIPIYIADEQSKKLTDSSPIIRNKLTQAFGQELYEGEELNKKLFASIIFNDKEKLALANSIIHPEIYKDFGNWAKKHQEYPFVILEAAILFESGMDKYIDKSIMIYTPLEIRIERVMNRDKLSKESVLSRIHSQMPDEKKAELSDHIIYNDETKSLIAQALNIIRLYDKRQSI